MEDAPPPIAALVAQRPGALRLNPTVVAVAVHCPQVGYDNVQGLQGREAMHTHGSPRGVEEQAGEEGAPWGPCPFPCCCCGGATTLALLLLLLLLPHSLPTPCLSCTPTLALILFSLTPPAQKRLQHPARPYALGLPPLPPLLPLPTSTPQLLIQSLHQLQGSGRVLCHLLGGARHHGNGCGAPGCVGPSLAQVSKQGAAAVAAGLCCCCCGVVVVVVVVVVVTGGGVVLP